MWKIQTLILVASLFFAFPAYADVSAYKLIKDKSILKFYAINNNIPIEGRFKDFSADIKFDPNKLKESKITVEVEIASLFANYDGLVKILLSEDWLASIEFPKAVFISKEISRMPGSDNYYADGTLELHGKTLPVVLNFQLQLVDDKIIIAKGYVTLHRNDYGIGKGEWSNDNVLKNEVRVEFRVVVEREQF